MKQETSRTRENLLNGRIEILFFKLSIPAILGMLMIGLYQFVDGIFIGQWVGTNGMGAVALVFPITLINNGVSSLVGVGASSILSRAIGNKNKEKINHLLTNIFVISMVITTILFVLAQLFAREFLWFLGGRGEILDLAETYFRIAIAGSYAVNFGYASNMLIRAEGRMKSAMTIMGVGTVLNIILDVILMRPLEMGIAGAAWATVIAQTTTAVLCMLYFWRSKESFIPFSLGRRYFSWEIIREILSIGFSAMAMPVIMLIQMLFILKAIEIYGSSDELVIVGATLRILNFIFIPLWGIAQGMQPLLGINFGAKQTKRVKSTFKTFTLASSILAMLCWLVITLNTEMILGFFIKDARIVAKGVDAFRIFVFIFPLYGFMVMSMTFFQAIGKAFHAAALVLGRMLIFFVPAILFLPSVFGIDGIWMSTPASDILVILIGLMVMLRSFQTLEQMVDKGDTKL